MKWAYFELLPTATLLDLHAAIRTALDEDDKLPSGEKKYLVREDPDFRQEAREIEALLDKRRQTHTRIPW